MCKKEEISMHSQKMRLISLNLVLVMLLTMIPVQAADIVIDDDGPMYTVVLNGNGGTYEDKETLSISYGSSTLYLEDYIFNREDYTLLGWSEKRMRAPLTTRASANFTPKTQARIHSSTPYGARVRTAHCIATSRSISNLIRWTGITLRTVKHCLPTIHTS